MSLTVEHVLPGMAAPEANPVARARIAQEGALLGTRFIFTSSEVAATQTDTQSVQQRVPTTASQRDVIDERVGPRGSPGPSQIRGRGPVPLRSLLACATRWRRVSADGSSPP